jgi:flagellar basal-body rod protein FlgG
MRALDTKLDVLANNLANVNTVGFKRSRTNFEDLIYQVRREPGIRNAEDEPIPHGILVGLGSAVSGTQVDHREGGIDTTGNPLDMLLEGEGFFQVTTIFEGQPFTAYTRAGNFTRNANGTLVLGNTDGSTLEPPVQVDPDIPISSIAIGRDGRVSVRENSTITEVGQVELARFVNPEGLLSIGKNLHIATDASGQALTGNPQTDGMGSIRQGALELSNVDPVRELIELITTQRAFELNSQSIQTADESLQIVGNLRR